jgi:hypothetical protein
MKNKKSSFTKILIAFLLLIINFAFSQDRKTTIKYVIETFLIEETNLRNKKTEEIFIFMYITTSNNTIKNNCFEMNLELHNLQYINEGYKVDSIYQFKNTKIIIAGSILNKKYFDRQIFVPLLFKPEIIKKDDTLMKRHYSPLASHRFYFNSNSEITFIDEPIDDRKYFNLLKEKIKFSNNYNYNTYNNPYGTNKKRKKKLKTTLSIRKP